MNDTGICAGCGAKYPDEVKDLFTKPGTTEEYCQACAGPLMLAEYLATKKDPPCPYCDGDGILGTQTNGKTLFCPWCDKGKEQMDKFYPVCIYCHGTQKIKAADGEMDCIMCRRPESKLFTTKEGLGGVRP